MLPSHVSHAVRPLLRLLAAQGAHTLLSLRASCGQMLVWLKPSNKNVFNYPLESQETANKTWKRNSKNPSFAHFLPQKKHGEG
jgi:hypothetical protein